MIPRPPRIPPEPGQQSAWDFPRPPAVVPSDRHVRVELGGQVVAESRRAIRVLETAGAPTWYLPPADVRMELLVPVPGRRTVCEWKGTATYFDLVVGERRSERAAWTYADPRPGFEAIRDHIAFYPARVDAALVDGERAGPQGGGFYGGWVTSDVVGPFKGDPGTEGW
ncbi:MAG TPA: DUF427 domain-containing protein [Candidatus Angelobacter sp.]|nr:DUF427 domain-containing protein [Candidatus Angelobacter sp.]